MSICTTAQPCWLSNTQVDGAGLNLNGTTNGTGLTINTVTAAPTTINFTGTSLVTVAHVEGTQCDYSISFPAVVTSTGLAAKYNLYGSPSPLAPQLLIKDWVPTSVNALTQTITYTVPVPFASTEIQWHFWVEASPATNGVGGLISVTGASVYTSSKVYTVPDGQQIDAPLNYPVDCTGAVLDTNYLDFIIQKARTDKSVVLTADGEPFDLYIRRWEGTACPMSDVSSSSDVKNPDLNNSTHIKCPYCFGTGFVGGYYKKIRIIARYNQNPARHIKYDRTGLVTQQALQSWTLWTPLLRAQDLIVQVSTGDRFYIQDVQRSMLRGVIMDQQYNNALCQRGEIVYTVTDAAIDAAFATYKTNYTDKTPDYPFEPNNPIWG